MLQLHWLSGPYVLYSFSSFKYGLVHALCDSILVTHVSIFVAHLGVFKDNFWMKLTSENAKLFGILLYKFWYEDSYDFMAGF